MKAAILHAPDDMRLQSVADPVSQPGDMLLRMRAATICGTYIRIFRGRKTRGVRYPSILGHEFVGEVIDTGEHVGWSEGDLVCVCPAIACGQCGPCRGGVANLCTKLTAHGYELDGGFAELIRVPRQAVTAGNVVRLPAGLEPEIAALAEPLACVINGQDLVDVLQGDRVVVLGAGPIGLLHIMLARHRGASRVIAVQRSAHRRAAALAMGADLAIDPQAEEITARVHDATGGRGADVVIVAAGSADFANLAMRLVRPRGRVSLFAGFPAGIETSFDLNALHYGEVTVTGAFGLTLTQFTQALDLIAGHHLPLRGLISHRLELDDVMEAFEIAEQGLALKVAVINGSSSSS